jgi:threonine dehydrogenase-like Zn-dependent dehydrogenase
MMRAVRNTPDGIRVVDVPDVEASGERVAIRAASICGSDFNYIAAGTRFTLGRELSGMTADGRAIAIEGTTARRQCELCAQGRYNISPTRLSRALGFGWDGGMSDWLHVPRRVRGLAARVGAGRERLDRGAALGLDARAAPGENRARPARRRDRRRIDRPVRGRRPDGPRRRHGP